MAFWALYGKPWFIRSFPDMIAYYKRYRYDTWYNSLSPEAKQKLALEKEKKDRETMERLRQLFIIYSRVCSESPYARDCWNDFHI